MLILASSSPRRMALLKEWGYVYQCISAPVPEQLPPGMDAAKGVRLLAERKAEAGCRVWLAQGGSAEDVVLGADTMVVLDGKALGKPANQEEASYMLRELSGREHAVLTGVALTRGFREKESAVIETRVRFRKLEQEEIRQYIESGEALDKAGAYGIQGRAKAFVESYAGSLTNVIGLPVEFVTERLAAWGIRRINIALREVEHGLPQAQRFAGGNVSP